MMEEVEVCGTQQCMCHEAAVAAAQHNQLGIREAVQKCPARSMGFDEILDRNIGIALAPRGKSLQKPLPLGGFESFPVDEVGNCDSARWTHSRPCVDCMQFHAKAVGELESGREPCRVGPGSIHADADHDRLLRRNGDGSAPRHDGTRRMCSQRNVCRPDE